MTDWQTSFPDLPVLDDIGQQLMEAASADSRSGWWRPATSRPARSLVLAGLLLIAIVATATAGTLVVLTGSVIPGPAAVDIPAEQTAIPGTARIADARAVDPSGGREWAVRVARSRTDFVCSTVGQVSGGQFGLVGLDGKFRRLAVGIVDGCGQARKNASTLIGARVFDADRLSDVRTVVSGIGGPDLRKVTVDAGGRLHRIRVGTDGIFVAAFRGYPEDLGVQVMLRFADGHVESHPLGTSRFVVPDPAGGQAWKLEVLGLGQPVSASCRAILSRGVRPCPPDPGPTKSCVSFRPARDALNQPVSEQVCGYLRWDRPPGRGAKQLGYFFGVRREVPGHPSKGKYGPGWRGHAPRTAVYGLAGADVDRIEVQGPGGTRQASIDGRETFLVMYGPHVLPKQLTIRVFTRDGRVRTYKGDTNLVPGLDGSSP